MSTPAPDPLTPDAVMPAKLPPGGPDPSFDGPAQGSVIDAHPELLAGGAFAGGLAVALILKRLGS